MGRGTERSQYQRHSSVLWSMNKVQTAKATARGETASATRGPGNGAFDPGSVHLVPPVPSDLVLARSGGRGTMVTQMPRREQ